jgi:hypothetical protein
VNIPREPEIDQIVLQAGPTGMAGFVPIGQDLAYLFLNVPWDRSPRPSPEELPAILREKLAPLAEELGACGPDEVEDAFIRYAARRYERCKFIVEASVQIGDWEMHPSPDADQAGLTQRVMETMALPL